MKELMVFEGKDVEVFELNGTVYFNPYHVGDCLGLKESAVRMAVTKMSDKQVIKLANLDVKDIDTRKLNNAGENFLTESGVYKLVFRSNKPKAEKFTDWVTDEVLPAIRKEGKYIIEHQPQLPPSIPKEELIKQQREKLKKGVITYNYLVDNIYQANGIINDEILNNFIMTIHTVNINIVDNLKNINKIQQKS